MSGRIAAAPISTDIGTVGDYRSRALVGDQREPHRQDHDEEQTEAHAPETPAPTPPPPPGAVAADAGTAFAAAVVAGSLPPAVQSPQEMQLRKGGAWAPPDSELHLTDRIA
jgi:hypothetical protein